MRPEVGMAIDPACFAALEGVVAGELAMAPPAVTEPVTQAEAIG